MKKVIDNHYMIEFYLDKEGQVYMRHSAGIENYEGKIKVDNMFGFLKECIKIRNPERVAKFIISKLEKCADRNILN